MKIISTSWWRILYCCVVFCMALAVPIRGQAQVCANPAGTIYGITTAGLIYPINTSNAQEGSALNVAAGSPYTADAIGYNRTNGKFYYINKNYIFFGTLQFYSYDPVLNISTPLAPPPVNSMAVACAVNPTGTGVYLRDANANFYYYSILLNTWTLITSSYTKAGAGDITSTIQNLSQGGDMAFDGLGNLWFLPSNANNFGLYKVIAPLPVTPVANLTLKEVIPPTRATPDGSIIAGIAFNPTGQIFLSTLNNNLYLLNSDLSVTLKGAFNVPNVGYDLTSCNFPGSVLPVNFISFTAAVKNNDQVALNWKAAQLANTDKYIIEH